MCGFAFRSFLIPRREDVLDHLKANGVAVSIVTNSVSYYADAVIRRFQLPCDFRVAYHDCPNGRRKPHPYPIERCLNEFSVPADKCLGVGDSILDLCAYHGAGITAWGGAGWSDVFQYNEGWHKVIYDPKKILEFFLTA